MTPLKTLGRDHSPAEAEETWLVLRDAKFPSLNLDVMFSIPGRELETWRQTLEHSLSLKPDPSRPTTSTMRGHRLLPPPPKRRIPPMKVAMPISSISPSTCSKRAALSTTKSRITPSRPSCSAHNEAYWLGGLPRHRPRAFSTVEGRRWKNVPDTDRIALHPRRRKTPRRMWRCSLMKTAAPNASASNPHEARLRPLDHRPDQHHMLDTLRDQACWTR